MAARPLLPMQLCTSDRRPLLAEPGAFQWQVKHDGFRAQVHAASGRLFSRQGTRLDAAFPSVVHAVQELLAGRDIVLDAELVVLAPDGRPDFEALSQRFLRGARAAAPAAQLMVFDVLVVDGEDVRPQPWHERSAALDDLPLARTARPGQIGVVRNPVHDDGAALLQATLELGLEGVVAVRRGRPYAPGRSGNWIKVKHAHARDLQGTSSRWRHAG